MILVDAPGKGNCLYHAIKKILTENNINKNIDEVRKDIGEVAEKELKIEIGEEFKKEIITRIKKGIENENGMKWKKREKKKKKNILKREEKG